jgi:DNA adenine methylase
MNVLLQDADSFCEPFVGGGSVVLEVATQHPNLQLFINDKDYWMSCFWQVVISDDVNVLIEKLSAKPTIDLFYELRTDKNNDKIHCAYKALFFNRTAFSGILKSGPIGGKEQTGKYKVDCRYNAKLLKDKVLKINKLLSGRTIVDNEDFDEYLKDKDCPVYLDPPYYQKGNGLYFETMNHQDHERLRNTLLTKNKWLLSYDKHLAIQDLYQSQKYVEMMDMAVDYCIDGAKKAWKNNNEYLILKNA